MTSTTRAAIYVRVSTPGQERDGSSLATQEASCREYAAARGWAISGVYREVFTGSQLWDRPQLTVLREAVRRHELDVIVCHALDRFGREPEHQIVLLSEAEHHGVRVEFVTEPLDDTPEGQLIRYVRGYAAKVERLKILERTHRGRRARQAAGKPHPSSRALYGYRWADPSPGAKDRLIEYPPEAAIVRRIFREAAEGRTLRQIAAGLTVDGIPPRGGPQRPWSYVAVSRVLSYPEYAGEAYANRFTYAPNHSKFLKPFAEWTPLPNVAPALVDAALWQAAAARQATARQQSPRRNRDPEAFLLRAGHVVCGLCGWRMSALNQTDKRRGTTHRYYTCARTATQPGACRRHYIEAERLDREVWEHLVALLTEDGALEAEVERSMADGALDADLAGVDRALAELERTQERLARALAKAPDIIQDRILAELAEAAQTARALEADAAGIRRRRAEREQLRTEVQAVRAMASELLHDPQTVTYELKRKALFGLDVVVRVWPQGVRPRFTVSAGLPRPEASERSEGTVFTPCQRSEQKTALPLRWDDGDLLRPSA